MQAQTAVAVLTSNHTLVRDHLDVLVPELFQAGVAAEIFTNTAALQEVLTRYGVL